MNFPRPPVEKAVLEVQENKISRDAIVYNGESRRLTGVQYQDGVEAGEVS
jgi:hypothetical protein